MPAKAAVMQVPIKGPKSFINTIGFLVGKQRAAQKHLGFARCAAATDMIKQILALPRLLVANVATRAMHITTDGVFDAMAFKEM